MKHDARGQPRSKGKTWLGALLLAVGLACFFFVMYSLARDLSLWVFGRQVMARVVDSWAERTSDADAEEHTFRYFVTYQFTTSNGESVVGSSSVAPVEWAGLGTAGRGIAGVDEFDNEPVGPSAPVYQEQEHVPQEAIGGIEDESRIAVVYFPLFPQHNRLDESRFIPLLACTYVPFILLGLVTVVLGWRLLRTGSMD